VLGIILFHALNLGALQFMGPQGWAYVLGGPVDTSNTNLLKNIKQNLHNSKTTKNAHMTPQQYTNMIVHAMTLDQKLGQMMLVQFNGATYSYALSTMISQYHIGSVMLFTVNGNVVSQTQLKGLVQQMQQDSGPIPLGVAIDQEGGAVDRLVHLDGPRPSEASIGATNMPAQATAAGMQDAKDLTSYGINMNLAPVVDVDNNVASELHVDQRTYGSNPATVIKMSSAYLKGLQQSGKVVGTLKHFPGLGDVVGDPHAGIPHLTRSKQALEQIDWAPYRALIKQGNVASIMVTHEVVDAIDSSKPASLSSAMIQGILRQDLGFKGVVMTDSLTMAGITDTYTPGQAAALSIEAGADMIMGAASPGDVASMIDNIKQEMTAGKITPQRIDDAVSRILMMKYKMGLITLP
jgi:beta-N-acetylhexosaminidase